MSNDLHLEAVRSITINTSNKQEEQSYIINVTQISESQGASKIANSNDPFKAYCDYIRKIEVDYKWEEEPIYLWDNDNSIDAYKIMIDCNFDDAEVDKYIVGYKKASDRLIKGLEQKIKEALDSGYVLNWAVW